MSEIRFKFNFESQELQSIDLPVEVRKPNLALVAQTVASRPVKVKAGTYHITAHLPTGQELYNQITVGDAGTYTVELDPEPENQSPSSSEEVDHYIVGKGLSSVLPQSYTLSGAKGVESLGGEEVNARLRIFRGYLLKDKAVRMNPEDEVKPEKAPARGVAKFSVRSSPCTVLQLLKPGEPAVNMLVPPPNTGFSAVMVKQGPDQRLSLDIHLHNAMADALLRYYERGLTIQAGNLTSSDSPALQSEDLLHGKVNDPISACVGAYTLLRLGDIRRLHEWTKNLKEWFEWLPDGIVIRAEHLARKGEHEQAFQIMHELPERGLPYFSDGLSYAANRLRMYVNLGKNKQPVEEDAQTEELLAKLRPFVSDAEELLAKLRPFVTYADFTKAILTFTGLDPNVPDRIVVEEDLDQYEGLDIGPYMG